MIKTIKQLLGMAPPADFSQLIKDGAVILDVRSKAEFAAGHVKGSVNIPVDVLQGNINKLNKDKPIITCCASGMRSEKAKEILAKHGFTRVFNGGSWTGLAQYKN